MIDHIYEYDVPAGSYVWMGNTAMVEGALAAGCRFFAGYPITPQNEVPERMSLRLPQVGGRFIQMEDEIGSISAVVGAALGGLKAMTSTSGPGFSLMQETMSWAGGIEAPIVVGEVQRSGPGAGIVSLPHHSDIIQAHYGGNGEYQVIAFAPSSSQELFDLTIEAFNAAETWRTPSIIFSDSWLGHIHEEVKVPPLDEIQKRVVPRKYVAYDDEGKPLPRQKYVPFTFADRKTGEHKISIPPNIATDYWPPTGWLPAVTHSPQSIPTEEQFVSANMVNWINKKITDNEEKIVKVEEYWTDDADVALITYGLPFRTALRSVKIARKEGIKAGLFRLVTVWPFARKAVNELSQKVKRLIVPEINLGQILVWVEAAVEDGTLVTPFPVISRLHEPKELLDKIKEVVN
ncbi:MAG: 2-oxoacid:acceptor oxidoreductase subunit alpha [Candidatus Helarchaeota archaeon]|nr:2-oxoacid:acceptor oxidoreductase subunit alpha [Candidatus Helarchaeota archaeon]